MPTLRTRRITLATIIVLAFAGSYYGKQLVRGPGSPSESMAKLGGSQDRVQPSYRRIVALAPSITETLFALGLGKRVVGVSKFSNYPPAARAKAKVGGYFDLNYGAIVTLKPDLVVILSDHKEARTRLEKLALHTFVVHHGRVSEILDSVEQIASVCGVEPSGRELAAELRARIAAVQARNPSRLKPRILISVGRAMGAESIKSVYAAGPGTFFDDIITLVGGVNAYDGPPLEYPTVSAEGILRLDPDLIVDLVPDLERKGLSTETVLKEWRSLGELAAVKRGRVRVLGGDYVVVPGPRFIRILEDIAQAIKE